jgi:tetratricopeptide (TPR) repeat protein
VILSRGKIRQESGEGDAAEAALRKLALLDTTAIPLDLQSSTERKAVFVLKQHALVTVDDKDLVAIHSLTQLAVHGQTDKGDRRVIAAGVVRALKERLAKFDDQKPATFFVGRRYAAHARAAAANAAAWGLIPGLPALASPGAAHRVGRAAGGGGEARDGRSLLGDVQGMCLSAGVFFHTMGEQDQQALGMFEFTLVCAVALEGHDSLDVATSLMNIANTYQAQGKYEEALEMDTKSLNIKTRILGGDHLLVAQTRENGNQDPRMRPRLPERGQFLQRRHYLRATRQVRGGARDADEVTRYQDPHLWRQPLGRGQKPNRHWQRPGSDGEA